MKSRSTKTSRSSKAHSSKSFLRGMRGLGVLLCLSMCVQTVRSQSYPRWFLEQGTLRCGLTAAGYANRGYYADSSASQAVRDGWQNLARQGRTIVSGGQAFWATEIGTAWMGSDLHFVVDSLALQKAASDTGAIQLCIGKQMILSLVSREKCDMPDSMKQNVAMPSREPSWIHSSANTGSAIFSVGVAPKYFYETSSWQAAERMAFVGLAKEAGDSVIAIEKRTTGTGQQVLNENISVTLRNYGVVARWFDARNQVFYVLASVERRNLDKGLPK